MAKFAATNRNPFFGVTSAPVYVNDRQVPNRMALVNDETGDVLGILSDSKYNIVSNITVANLFGEAFDRLPVLKQTDHLNADASAWKRRIILDKSAFDLEIVNGDSIGVMIEVCNSYNGKTSWGYNLVGYRWICDNGMVFGRRNLFSQTFGHMQDAVSRIQNKFGSQIAGIQNVLETWRGWTRIDFPAEKMELYMVERDVPKRVITRVMETYEERNHVESLKPTVYAAFNTFTFLGSHNDKTRKGIDPAFSATNQRFMDLAEGLYRYQGSKALALPA